MDRRSFDQEVSALICKITCSAHLGSSSVWVMGKVYFLLSILSFGWFLFSFAFNHGLNLWIDFYAALHDVLKINNSTRILTTAWNEVMNSKCINENSPIQPLSDSVCLPVGNTIYRCPLNV